MAGPTAPRARPLAGVSVVEMAGLGPVPFAATMLIGLGADVVRISAPRVGRQIFDPDHDVHARDRRTVVLNLHSPTGLAEALTLIARADVLLEGFRPGVMERLGLSPGQCHAANPRLVYGRMTGWGQKGPAATTAGHDINYLAMSGALSLIGERGGKPVPPVNLAADFGGGGMLLIAGVLAGLVSRATSGFGTVIDAAMVDGIGLLLGSVWTLRNAGDWSNERGTNLLDGGAPFYDTYACADGQWIAVGAIEAKFYSALLDGLREFADVDSWPAQLDRAQWPTLRLKLRDAFARCDRDYWAERFRYTDACLTAVLTLDEATAHEHMVYRGTYYSLPNGDRQPAPAPRFSDPAGIPVDPTADKAGDAKSSSNM